MFHLFFGLIHGIFHLIFGLIWTIIVIAVLIDIFVSPNLTCLQKVVWALVVLFIPCIGVILYFLLGRRRGVV